MKTRCGIFAVILAATAVAQKQPKPLVIEDQGSFFVGGETKALPAPPPPPGAPAGRGGPAFGGGDITINQMYVQYQIPPNGNRHVPVVMVHGCCLSSKTWETWTNMAALAVKLKGAILMGHSESGFFPEQAALIDPSGVRGVISIEMPCATDLKPDQIKTLAKIPTLVMFGDHLGDVQGFNNWPMSFDSCNTFVKQVNAAGGDAEMMSLPKMGIKGNSHMLMQDKNNLQLADLILAWVDKHVEKKAR